MSVIHRCESEELSDVSLYELLSILGERDTPKIYEQRYTIDSEHDCPTGGGNSLDRKTKIIDRVLYQEVMDGEFKATGLTPAQIIDRWCDHEHTEVCISDGDNACDTYYPCHKRGLKKEHMGVLAILVPKTPAEAKEALRRYESAIWPGLLRCYHRPVTKPRKDYWCGPLLDQPSERDEEILQQLRRLGVVDAQKRAKFDARYGFGQHECGKCRYFHPEFLSQEGGQLAGCRRVSGLVRQDRGCELWESR